MSEPTTQEYELHLQEAKEIREKGKAFDRLIENKDFINVVSEGYFEKEAIRLTYLLSDPAMDTPEHQDKLLQELKAIASVRQYFMHIRRQGQMAANTIKDYEEEYNLEREKA